MTIAEALDVSQRSISFREAEIFLAQALGVNRAWLHTHPEQSLSTTEQQHYQKYIHQREQNEPVAYIIGEREFYGRSFRCDKRALIPRPETEGLIDLSLTLLPDYFQRHLKETNKPCPLRILELGTGCGNICISLALELQKYLPVTIWATDISAEALELAQENWQLLQTTGLARIHFLKADLFNEPTVSQKAPFDLIIANLPYVPTTWQLDPAAQAEVVFQEPDIALFGGEDGLSIYRQFFQAAPSFLKETGYLLIEFGEDETKAIQKLAQAAFPDRQISILQDYAGLDRILQLG